MFIRFGYSFDQENLRNRVAYSTFSEDYNPDPSVYDYATFYSYDIHGNVKSLVQDNRKMALDLGLPVQRYKKIDYEYDLISGKVNTVTYQKDQPDRFYHRYEYDADNRLTNVYTSTNGVQWDHDAKYLYYAHGPLARMELGDDHVQGVDYAYTLQGWIKGVNSNLQMPENDMGNDALQSAGNTNADFARDAMGYTLNYFKDDYDPIGTPPAFEASTVNSDVMSTTNDLWNGNIKMMATTVAKPDTSNLQEFAPLPQANAYQYDSSTACSPQNLSRTLAR